VDCPGRVKRYAASLLACLALVLMGGKQECRGQQSIANDKDRKSHTGLPALDTQPKKGVPLTFPIYGNFGSTDSNNTHDSNKSNRSYPHLDSFANPKNITASEAVFEDIPKYGAAAKFRSGAVLNEFLMVVTYTVSDPVSQVKEWYQNALVTHDWRITFQSDKAINAIHNRSGNKCTIEFGGEDAKKDSPSIMQIDYLTEHEQ
jgi:hypothetical protein